MTDRPYLSIGDVLALLRDEFPDITISKIRFLESRGLLDPERTPSGYRKFYEADVERLRWILRQQREHFLPLKIIKGRLEGGPATLDEPPSLFDTGGDAGPEHASSRALVGAFASIRPVGPGGQEPDAPAPWARAGEDPTVRHAEQPAEPFGGGLGGRFGDDRPPAEDQPRPSSAGSASRAEAGRPTGEEGAPVTTSSDPAPAGADETVPEEARQVSSDEEAPEADGGAAAVTQSAGTESAGAESEGAGGLATEGRKRGAAAPPPASKRGVRGSAGALSPSRAAVEEGAVTDPGGGGGARGRGRRPRSIESGASFTPAELADASGLELADVERLEEFGLLTSRLVAGVRCYDEEGLVVARLAAGFARYGVEPRHLRTFKHAAEREAGLFEQVVIPLLRQRNPEARSRAAAAIEELTELGAALQASLLGSTLRDVTG